MSLRVPVLIFLAKEKQFKFGDKNYLEFWLKTTKKNPLPSNLKKVD
jgi:hypothetical protein